MLFDVMCVCLLLYMLALSYSTLLRDATSCYLVAKPCTSIEVERGGVHIYLSYLSYLSMALSFRAMV